MVCSPATQLDCCGRGGLLPGDASAQPGGCSQQCRYGYAETAGWTEIRPADCCPRIPGGIVQAGPAIFGPTALERWCPSVGAAALLGRSLAGFVRFSFCGPEADMRTRRSSGWRKGILLVTPFSWVIRLGDAQEVLSRTSRYSAPASCGAGKSWVAGPSPAMTRGP